MPHFIEIVEQHPQIIPTRQARCYTIKGVETSPLYGTPALKFIENRNSITVEVVFRPVDADTPWEELPSWVKVSPDEITYVFIPEKPLWAVELKTDEIAEELPGKIDQAVMLLKNVSLMEHLAGLQNH